MIESRTTITPRIDFANHVIRLEEMTETPDLSDIRGPMLRNHAIAVVNLRDKAVRDALICLGWRPPVEPEDQHSSTPVDDAARLRVRAQDPSTSVSAAEKTAAFAGNHSNRILSVCSRFNPMTAAEIAAKSGLTVVQVLRRTHELKRDGRLVVAQLCDEDMVVDGYRCWLLAPTKS